jgi:hypothetical protein
MAADASPILAPLVKTLKIVAGPFTFRARLEEERAPQTTAAIRSMLPFTSKLVHCRWSGESTWVPMGDTQAELLFPYGSTLFSSKVGQLAGNHFATVIEGNDKLAEVGRLALWEGAQDFTIELA